MKEQIKKTDVIDLVFADLATKQADLWQPQKKEGLAFAPTNIALCKYWGKRDTELNLPMTASLSIALPDKGALTRIVPHDLPHDVIILNDQTLPADSSFVQRTSEYL